MRRIKDYGIVDHELPVAATDSQDTPTCGPPTTGGRPSPQDLARMNAEREVKLRRYKQRKELESQLKDLRIAADPKNEHRDDDTLRKFYLALIQLENTFHLMHLLFLMGI